MNEDMKSQPRVGGVGGRLLRGNFITHLVPSSFVSFLLKAAVRGTGGAGGAGAPNLVLTPPTG